MPGIKLQYGKHGIKTEFAPPKTTQDLHFDAEKLRHQLFKPYETAHEIKSAVIGQLTSDSLKDFKKLLLASNDAYEDTSEIIRNKSQEHVAKDNKLKKLQNSLLKFLFKKRVIRLSQETAVLNEEIIELKEQLLLSTVNLEIDTEDVYFELFSNVVKAFELLTHSQKKWDFTSSKQNNMAAQRTSASSSVTRSDISISFKHLPILKSEEQALCFHNMNGGDLYFYPGFLIVFESKRKFDLISYTDIHLNIINQQFIETEKVPSDSKIIDHTWLKVNKDGSPDKRFKGNYQIPVVMYGRIELLSKSGLNEAYCFSNVEYSQLFAKALTDYISNLKTAASLLNEFK